MPYKALGQVKNATTQAAVSLDYDGAQAVVRVYATSVYEQATVELWAADRQILKETVSVSPVAIYEKQVPCEGVREEELYLAVYAGGECLVEYQPEKAGIPKLPDRKSVV